MYGYLELGLNIEAECHMVFGWSTNAFESYYDRYTPST
jgi:hypothetical protein